jgi:hypothetical protein
MNSGFAYAQSRVQARFAGLADEAVWQQLEGARTLSGFLEEARHTPLDHWVSAFSQVSDHHHIEQGLSRQFHGFVELHRQWAPIPWRPAVDWSGWLPELPLLQRLAQQPPPAYAPLKPSPPAELVTADATPIAQRWLNRWRDLWPPASRVQRQGMDGLVALFRAHLAAFGELPTESAWDARNQLAQALRRLFRRHALQPTALFCGLALGALELERLRAALVVRAAFPAGGP